MRLLEYQAKELFKEFGIRVPDSKASKDIEQGRLDAKELGYPFVIKAQVPVGGRGKAGGIQVCNSDDEFEIKYTQILGMSIKGEKTRAILLEKMTIFPDEVIRRNEIAKYYSINMPDYLKAPYVPNGYISSWAQYSIIARSNTERESIIKHLKEADIPAMIYYRLPIRDSYS